MSSFEDFLQNQLQRITEAGLLRQPAVVGPAQGTMVESGGRTLHNFSSNDYLGLANHPTDCGHLADRFVTTLSGGEMQRVQLSRVLLQLHHPDGDAPRCLLLDEPISNLDPAHQHRSLSVARQLAASGAGVLVVLHDLNLAAQYADRIVIMKGGRIVAEGIPREVVTGEIVSSIFEVRAQVIQNPVCDAPAVFVSVPEEGKG
jgi:ABC-type hemin transport system ATPase subunit